jgi:hypothetical protein
MYIPHNHSVYNKESRKGSSFVFSSHYILNSTSYGEKALDKMITHYPELIAVPFDRFYVFKLCGMY